jgi:hypothetical protein
MRIPSHAGVPLLQKLLQKQVHTGINRKKRMPKGARPVSPFAPNLAASRDSSNLSKAGPFICPSDD